MHKEKPVNVACVAGEKRIEELMVEAMKKQLLMKLEVILINIYIEIYIFSRGEEKERLHTNRLTNDE